MAEIVGESSEGKPDGISPEGTGHKISELIEENIPWMDYAVQQAQIAQKTVENAMEVTELRFDRIVTTSSAHFNRTIDSLHSVKSDCNTYEDIVFGKIKEGFLIASSHPLMASGASHKQWMGLQMNLLI